MTDNLRLSNARIVLADHVITGHLIISSGKIVEIRAGGAAPAQAIDRGGDTLIPGLIEVHTDNLEGHIEPRPRVNWPHDAAIIAHDAGFSTMRAPNPAPHGAAVCGWPDREIGSAGSGVA